MSFQRVLSRRLRLLVTPLTDTSVCPILVELRWQVVILLARYKDFLRDLLVQNVARLLSVDVWIIYSCCRELVATGTSEHHFELELSGVPLLYLARYVGCIALSL